MKRNNLYFCDYQKIYRWGNLIVNIISNYQQKEVPLYVQIVIINKYKNSKEVELDPRGLSDETINAPDLKLLFL